MKKQKAYQQELRKAIERTISHMSTVALCEGLSEREEKEAVYKALTELANATRFFRPSGRK